MWRRGEFRVRTWAGLIIAAMLLTGCQVRVNQTMREIRSAIRRTTVAAEVPTNAGLLTLYRYTALGRCGEGYSLQGGGGGVGEGDCDITQPFTAGGGASGSAKPDEAIALLYGVVNDPRIDRMIVTMKDGQKLNATLAKGMWYVLFPGVDKIPDFKSIEGFDKDGKVIGPGVKG